MPKTTNGQPPWEHQPYSIKRHGLTITNCDMEPVQTPGCVQAHGALLVLRQSDLSILQASENTGVLLGIGASALLGRPVESIIGNGATQNLRQLTTRQANDGNPFYLATLPAINEHTQALDVTVHISEGVVILELESTGRSHGTQPDYYGLVKSTVARLQKAESLQELCHVAAQEIRRLTGQDRVMVYKFHADGHGEVIAESRRENLEPWLGLHYPAEDIPKPARDVFLKTWIRPVPDVAGALAELVPLVNPDSGKALNMTFCALRGVSVMYTEYLQNMGVAAALTMAIRQEDRLWGLIACHHYEGAKHTSYEVRAACEFLSQVVTLQHRAAEEKEHSAYRQKVGRIHHDLVTRAMGQGGISSLTSGHPSLLDGIDAGGAAVLDDERWSLIGNTPTEPEIDALRRWLVDHHFVGDAPSLYSTDELSKVYPPATGFSSVASGLIALPVSPSGRSFIMWFRPETLQTVEWGGNPHDKPSIPGPHGPRLSPRHSFDLFSESVRHRSLPWLPVEMEAAATLRIAVLDIMAGQVEERIDADRDMARSNEELDAFAYLASHDLKKPLQGIHRYANELIENPMLMHGESRSKLDRVVRLAARMDSLLDSMLHSSRIGGTTAGIRKSIDLNRIIDEALESVGFRAGANLVLVPRMLPSIQASEVQCRQIFTNLLSNAFKYSDRPVRQVEIGYIAAGENHPRPHCPADLTDRMIFYVADNGIGVERQNHEKIFTLFKRLHGPDDYGGGSGAGLTIVTKLISQLGGKIWIDSDLGNGTTFYFTLSRHGEPGEASAMRTVARDE